MKEFIKKFVDEEVSLWSLDEREGVIEMLEDFLKALQKAKQKEAIEQSTNWQMKEEQPELSAEEFLRSKMEQEDLKDYFANFYLGISGKRYYMKDLLTEFKNQNG